MDKYDYNFLYNLLNLTSKPFEPEGETFKPDLCFYQFWYVDHEHKYFSWRFCIREYVDFKAWNLHWRENLIICVNENFKLWTLKSTYSRMQIRQEKCLWLKHIEIDRNARSVLKAPAW